VDPSTSATYSVAGSRQPDLVVEDPRDVDNRRNVPGGRRRSRAAAAGLPRGLRDLRGFRPALVRAEQKRDDKIRDVR
jgi:hypothetical protein